MDDEKRNKVRQVLLRVWDPVGIADQDEAQDEYDAYVGQVYKRLVRDEPEDALFEYLWWLETECMGFIGDRGRTESTVAALLKLRDEVS
jgi:hypothetical protein